MNLLRKSGAWSEYSKFLKICPLWLSTNTYTKYIWRSTQVCPIVSKDQHLTSNTLDSYNTITAVGRFSHILVAYGCVLLKISSCHAQSAYGKLVPWPYLQHSSSIHAVNNISQICSWLSTNHLITPQPGAQKCHKAIHKLLPSHNLTKSQKFVQSIFKYS